ncbi:hypothetical protein DXA90_15625, partial [Clostridiaceae bacterium OF09-1]
MGSVVLLSGFLCANCVQSNIQFLFYTWTYMPNDFDIIKIIFYIAIILEAVLSLSRGFLCANCVQSNIQFLFYTWTYMPNDFDIIKIIFYIA